MRLIKTFPALWIALAALPATAQISRPQLGVMLDSNGGFRPVFGVPASATLGDPVAIGVLSAGCTAQLCLAKTPSFLWGWSPVTNQVWNTAAPPGPALFAFSASGAFVYFSAASILNEWSGGNLIGLSFRPDGEVLALHATNDGLDYAVRRNQSTFVEHLSTATGSVSLIASLGTTGAVALLDTGTLIASSSGVNLQRSDGSFVTLAVPSVQSLTLLGEGFVQATTAENNWVIRVDAGREQAFLLPGMPAPAERTPSRPARPRMLPRATSNGVTE